MKKSKKLVFTSKHLVASFLVGGAVVLLGTSLTSGNDLQGKFSYFAKDPAPKQLELKVRDDLKVTKNFDNLEVQQDNSISRAEMAAILTRSFDLEVENCNADFSDVIEDDWYYEPVCTLANLGYLQGYPDGSFRPNGDVNRAEMAKFVYSLMDADYACNLPQLHPDVSDDQWYYQAVNELSAFGIFAGETEVGENFRPADLMMRGEVDTWMDNL